MSDEPTDDQVTTEALLSDISQTLRRQYALLHDIHKVLTWVAIASVVTAAFVVLWLAGGITIDVTPTD